MAATWEEPTREKKFGLDLSTSVSWAADRNQESSQRWNPRKNTPPCVFWCHGWHTALVWNVRAQLNINPALSRVCYWENGSFHCTSSCLSANAKSSRLWHRHLVHRFNGERLERYLDLDNEDLIKGLKSLHPWEQRKPWEVLWLFTSQRQRFLWKSTGGTQEERDVCTQLCQCSGDWAGRGGAVRRQPGGRAAHCPPLPAFLFTLCSWPRFKWRN